MGWADPAHLARSRNHALSRQAEQTGRLADAHTRQAEALERIAAVLEQLVAESRPPGETQA